MLQQRPVSVEGFGPEALRSQNDLFRLAAGNILSSTCSTKYRQYSKVFCAKTQIRRLHFISADRLRLPVLAAGMAEPDEEGVHITSPTLHIAQEVLLVFVIAAAIILNFSVVYVICRNKNLRKITTNIFILNLVVSNALMAIFVMPLSLATFIKLGWNIDSTLCKVRKSFLNFS